MGMTDAVESVDTESEAGEYFDRHIELINSGNACHVFVGRSQSIFVASQQAVSATIHKKYRVDAMSLHQ